jgi:NAD(P)-dependent dehydrogenase (short-subunit alcohol dehydrogenase family)
MAPNTVYVITGANRGIGLGLVQAYLFRRSTTVIGVVRSEEASKALKSACENTTRGADSALHILQVDLSKNPSTEDIRNELQTATGGLDHINTVICCAGHVTPMVPTLAISPDDLRACIEVNAIGPLTFFQAFWPLLEKSSAATGAPPKFIVLSSSVGSIGAMEPFPGGAYGPSKAAVNHITKSLHVQMAESGLVAVALHPGWVKTNMGQFVAEQWEYAAGPPLTVEESVRGIVKVVDGASRETTSGKFVTETGEEVPW